MVKRNWDLNYRLSYLPLFPRNFFIKEAEFLYSDLINNHLIVKLIPAPIPIHSTHKIRVVESNNLLWYSELYSKTNRGKRRLFEKSLARLVKCEDQDFNKKNGKYSYDKLFRELIYSRLVNGYIEEDCSFVLPNNSVRKFFGLDEIIISKEGKRYVQLINNYL